MQRDDKTNAEAAIDDFDEKNQSRTPQLRLLVVRTMGLAAETLQTLLEERGALGSAIEHRPGTRRVRLQAYFPADADVPLDWIHAKLKELHANGVPVGPAEVQLMPLRGEDWAESWKRHFHAIRSTSRLTVVPKWEEVPDDAIDVIRLDPGMAFGQGDHPTTRGCLEMLERMAAARSVGQAKRGRSGSTSREIGAHADQSEKPAVGVAYPTADVGCGTGILAIRAVQLGMGPVEGFDTEADAIRSAKENAERNGVAGQVVFHEGTMPARGAGPYERILANIFFSVLTDLFPRMARSLVPGGEVLVAGILGEQEDELLAAAHKCGFTVVDRICEVAPRGEKRWPVLRLRKTG